MHSLGIHSIPALFINGRSSLGGAAGKADYYLLLTKRCRRKGRLLLTTH